MCYLVDGDCLYNAQACDDVELPKRKRIRLEGYDYSSSGVYFVTICVKDRNALLWENVGANCVRPNEIPPLSGIGKMIDSEIGKLNDIYAHVIVDKYCIMPDHIHMLIFILPDDDGRTQFAPTDFYKGIENDREMV